MKNITRISFIFSCALFLTFLISCQNDEEFNATKIETAGSEIKILDESFLEDLESLKGVSIRFGEKQFSIEKVLTDPELFELYKTAPIHHTHDMIDSNGETTSTMFVYSDKEKGLKKIEELKAKLSTNRVGETLGLFITLYDKDNQKGKSWGWSAVIPSLKAPPNDWATASKNLSGYLVNRANSMEVEAFLPGSGKKGLLRVYRNKNLRGTKDTYTFKKSTDNHFTVNFNKSSVGNNNIESVWARLEG